MLTGNRVILSDNGALTDLSRELNDVTTGTKVVAIVAAEDKLYLGSEAPFNHRWLMVSVANDQASVASVKLWSGSAWESALDVIDQTSVGGATLAQSGILSWTKNRDKAWVRAGVSTDIAALASGPVIYDMYWAEVSFSGNLKNTTALKYVGHKFADDNHLAVHYPDLVRTSVLTAFKTGKTNWDEQHVAAAEELIADLRGMAQLWSGSQILDWEKFNLAAVHKCANVIMRAFGDDYAEQREDAQEEYDRALRRAPVGIDRDQDGSLDRSEKLRAVGLFRA